MVIGASAGPMVGELPMGISTLFSSACAIPPSSRTAIQSTIFFSMADRRGDTAVSPLLLNIIVNFGFIGVRYILPAAFIHFGYLFLALSSGKVPLTISWNVPGLAKVPR